MISLVTFDKIARCHGLVFELWGGSSSDAIQAPHVRHFEISTLLTTHEPEMPRLSRKGCAIVTIPRGILLHQGDAKPINTHRAGIGLAV